MGRITTFLIASIIPLSAISVGAQAQETWGGRPVTAYVDGLQWQIDTAAQDGRISWQQHRWLQRDLDEAKPLAWKVQTNTASYWERERLNRDVDEIQRAIHGGEYRGYEYRGYQWWNEERPWSH